MAKRTASSAVGQHSDQENDDPVNDNSSRSKRARRDSPDDSRSPSNAEDSDVDELSESEERRPPKKQAKGNERAIEPSDNRSQAARTNGNDDEEEDEVEGSDIEGSTRVDQESESDGEETRRATQAATEYGKSRTKGVPGEAGVLDRVILKNFMCHRYLDVPLCQQINFITGNNGSGKSVILTGITFAFGAKAASTNRAASQKDFVRSGASFAEVHLALRNRGEDSYRPDVYGKTIWIIRRVTDSGSSSYKIQSHSKTTISTKRDELAKILDFYQIQVENPINILNQDMAKSFLNSSKPQDKYNFFLKGTQLAQLTDEYNAVAEKVTSCKQIIEGKGGRLKDLQQNMKEAEAAWKQMKNARDAEVKLRNVENELAWVIAQDAEEALKPHTNAEMQARAKVKAVETKIKMASDAVEEALEKVATAERARGSDDAIDPLATEKDELNAKLRAAKLTVQEIKAEQRQQQSVVDRLKGSIASFDKQIQEARSLQGGAVRDEVIRAQKELAVVTQQHREAAQVVTESSAQSAVLQGQLDEGRKQWQAARTAIDNAAEARSQAERIARSCQAAQSGSLSLYGREVPNIMTAISGARWRVQPVGPVGQFVKLKDQGQGFAKVCDNVLGDILASFITFTQEDRATMKRILAQARAYNNIYMFEQDPNFDFSQGVARGIMMERNGPVLRPDDNTMILLNVLQIDHPAALQLLITQAKVEGTILVPTRQQGDDIMTWNDPNVTNVVACFSADCYRLGGIHGGAKMIALPPIKRAPRLSKDVAGDYRRAEENVREMQSQYTRAQEQLAAVDRQQTELTRNKARLEASILTGKQRVRNMHSRMQELTEASREEDPPDIRALEESKQDAEREVESTTAQAKAMASQVVERREEMIQLGERLVQINAHLKQKEDIQRAQQAALEEVAANKVRAEDALRKWQDRLRDEKRIAQEKADIVKREEAIYLSLYEDAQRIVPKDQVTFTGRNRKKCAEAINALKKSLRQQEELAGGTAEDIHARCIKAQEDYNSGHQHIAALKACAAALTKAYNQRLDRWVVFRGLIASRANMMFIHNLTSRGFTGRLKFNFADSKLVLEVDPQDSGTQTQRKQRAKDTSGLSGGEKSFSTVCLLLALWDCAGCPIRGLDEYDVFMDAANRHTATKMLIDAGTAKSAVQMILISPQSVQGYHGHPGVRVHKIADPERGQGTLATGTKG